MACALGIEQDCNECRMCGNGKGGKKITKPKDIEEVQKFIFEKLKEKYGNSVLSEKPSNNIVIDTDTEYHGNSDVWIELNYFC